MSPPFASSEGVSASGDRLQSDGVQDTHLLPHNIIITTDPWGGSSTQYAYKCQGEKNILDEK